jgi:predicted nucleic acid-binding protein
MPDSKNQHPHEAATPPTILLDNNILQHFLNKDTGAQLQDILQEVEKIGAVLAVSDIVLYESLKAIAFNDAKSAAVTGFINKYLTRYQVDDNILTQAARVHEIYGSDSDTRQRRSGISTEDIIIGTTAMILGAYVMTCDCNDFPAPFFKENNRQIIYYDAGNKRKYFVMYLLEPDNAVIAAALEDLTPQKRGSKKSV